MPVAPPVSYPGVYIQEVPSDVRTIVPVDTATTAFVGRALRGPVDTQTVINSYAEFETVFGGLWLQSAMTYAVRDFFVNGGSKAIIVRVYELPLRSSQDISAAAKATAEGFADASPDKQVGANAVAKAAQDAAAKPNSTAKDVSDAAKAAAVRFANATADKKAGAVEVATAAQDAAAKPDSTAATVSAAAEAAAEGIANAPEGNKAGADAVAKAAEDAAAKPDSTAATVSAAAEAAAEGIANATADKKAGAEEVAKAAEDAAAAADSTAATVSAAAKAAADGIAGATDQSGDKKAGAQAVAKAANDMALEPIDGKANLTFGDASSPLTLEASNPGTWGNQLRGRVTAVDAKVSSQVAKRYGVTEADLFNLIIRDIATGTEEVFPNVTVTDGPRRLDKVLAGDSQLVRVAGDLPSTVPPFTGTKSADNTILPLPPKGNWWDDTNGDYHVAATSGSGNDGATPTEVTILGSEAQRTGMYALEHANIFNMLCLPPFDGTDVAAMADVSKNTWDTASAYCERRRAMLVVDSPGSWNSKKKAVDGFPNDGSCPSPSENAMLYFPRLNLANPLRDGQVEAFVPCGAVAGIIARTDAARGVWKAPAGLEAGIRSVRSLTVPLTDAENGELNPLGINCLRTLPAAGNVVWGARTTVGDDRLASQWKYIPVRRTALFIEETLYRNTQWAVFEPNDEPLWSQLRLNIGVFMHDLFRQGAFQGGSPKDAYFVRCDATTTTQSDIDRGIVNVIVGFAPLKPAEFVVIYIQQIAGQLAA